MKTYNLHLQTLLMFFKLQQATDFEAIRTVLQILEDPELPDHHVAPYIRSCLREAGLNDISYKEGRFEPSPENRRRLDAFLERNTPTITINVHRQTFEANLLSGRHQFAVILN